MAIYPDRKDGKLTGRYRVEVQREGRRVRGRFNSLEEAQAKEKEWKASMASGKAPEGIVGERRGNPSLTLGDLLREAQDVLWRNIGDYKQSWQRLRDTCGILGLDTKLNDVDTAMLDDLVCELEDENGLSAASVNRYLSSLCTALRWALDRKLRTTPLPKFPWHRETSRRIRWITPEEEATLIELLPPNIGMVVKVAIKTGMRRSELLRLKEKDVEPQWVRLWKTKNGDARSVPIDKETYNSLRWLLRTGGMPNQRVLHYHWEKARKKMGMADDKDFVFHACRHTCATRLVQANVNLRLVQAWLGHRDIKTTLRYAQVNDTMLMGALGQLNGGGTVSPSDGAISAPTIDLSVLASD